MMQETTTYISDVLAAHHKHHRWHPPRLSGLLPSFRRDLLAEASQCTSAWRAPSYMRWFSQGSYLENVRENGRGSPLTFAQKAIAAPYMPFLPASFIEWRYYAILTEGFHGILGAAIFNPTHQLENVAEGGLLCIVAGTVPGQASGSRNHICWQHLFPMSSLRFGGDRLETVECAHEGCVLAIEQYALNAAKVSLSGPRAPRMHFEHVGLGDSALFPCLVEDLKRVPGAHWIVHNPSPVAHVRGSFQLSAQAIAALGFRSAQEYPNYASEGLHECASRGPRASGGAFESEIVGSGYYEHSFGLNPMPLHGWDFMFAPDFERGQGLVMQTYLRSDALRFIEVIWTEDGERKYTRFGKDDFSMRWSREQFHPHIRASVPMQRTIRGSRGGYTLEIVNDIEEQLPFLRKRKLIVRHFFISEETGRTSWILRDAGGRVVARSREGGVLSGGEVAYPRVYTPSE